MALSLVIDYDNRVEVEKELCSPCAQAVEIRVREWCGEEKPASSGNWLQKGWP